MDFTFYEPAPRLYDEAGRDRAIERSRLKTLAGDPVLQSIVELAAGYVRTPMAAVTVIQGDEQIVLGALGLTAGVTSRATSLCGHAIASDEQPFTVQDASRDERFAGNPLVVDEPHIRFYAAAPLLSPDRRRLGTLCVFSPEPREPLSPDEAAVLDGLAQRVMLLVAEPAEDSNALATG